MDILRATVTARQTLSEPIAEKRNQDNLIP